MVHADVPNVVVLMSPNKPFGIAGTRTAVMWTADETLRTAVAGRRLNWPLSYLDAAVAVTALRAVDWLADSRARLLSAANRMETLLGRYFPSLVGAVPVHYRFVAGPDADSAHRELVRSGVVARLFDGHEPGRVAGLRITTPLEHELPALGAALAGRDGRR
jgi:histidinol-phosphate aminotransferase